MLKEVEQVPGKCRVKYYLYEPSRGITYGASLTFAALNRYVIGKEWSEERLAAYGTGK